MSDRICFISKNNKDISNIELPKIIGGSSKYCSPRYDDDRKCIFTYIKTIEFYGDREYDIMPDIEYKKQIEDWANKNDLLITSDYELYLNKNDLESVISYHKELVV